MKSLSNRMVELSAFAAAVGSASLSNPENLERVGHSIIEEVAKLTGSDRTLVYVANAETEQLELLAESDPLTPSELAAPEPLLKLAASAFRTQEIHIVENLEVQETNLESASASLALEQRSLVALPLLPLDRPIGAMVLGFRQPATLTSFEKELLLGIARVSAVSLAQARALAAGRKEEERAHRLRNVVASMKEPLPLRDLLRALVDQACQVTDARYGALAVLEAGARNVSDFIFVGMSETEARKIGECPLGRGLLSEVVTRGEALRVADISRDPRSVGFPLHHPPMKSFLGVPLRIKDEDFGNFYLCDKSGGLEFTEDDERLLELLGVHSSLAIAYARQLLRAEESHRQVTELRDEFAAIIAHDLRTPISVIALQVEDLLVKSESQGDQVMVPVAALERVRRNAYRLRKMSTDLLEASRIDLKRVQVERRPVSLSEAATSLVSQLNATLGHRAQVSVISEPPPVLADPLRLDQILTNLLENAAKYSIPGTPIRVLIRSQDNGGLVTVEDQGMGIAPEEIPRLFERFYQARRARQKKSGLGLGLFITKGLVEAQHGRIWVESTLGQGSRFHVWLPSAEDQSPGS